MTGGDNDWPENKSCDKPGDGEGTAPVDRATLEIVLASLETANARAADASGDAVDFAQVTLRRAFIAGLVILLLLGAVLGVAINVETPSGSIGFDPAPVDGP